MTLKDRLIKVTEAFYGCETGDAQQKMIVSLYNQINPLPRGYRLKDGDAWCAAFVSACSYVVGALDRVFPECGAHEMWNKYPDCQRNREHGKQAERGDILFYDWDADGRIDHVGIVLERLEDALQVIEGNFGGKCDIRFVTEEAPEIYGTVRPEWREGDVEFAFVDCDSLNLREAPSMDAKIIDTMDYTEMVEVLSSADGWTKVRLWSFSMSNGDGDIEGYCGSGYLSKEYPPIEGETTTAVYLREGAGTGHKIICVLPAKTSFNYSGDREMVGSSVWERISTRGEQPKTGWVNLKFTRKTL